MSTLRMVQVGTMAAQSAIDVAAQSVADIDAAALRVGVLAFLHSHAAQTTAEPGFENLLDAYRAWLATATSLYSTGDETKIREYMHHRAILGAEMDIAVSADTSEAAVS